VHDFALLGHGLDQRVGNLDGDTHLQKVFGEYFIIHLVLCSLGQQELDDGTDNFGLIRVEFLVPTELSDLVVVVSLAAEFFDNLSDHQLQLDSTHAVQQCHLRKDPFGTVSVATEFESHL